MQPWELNQTQRLVIAKRADLEQFDAVLGSLGDMLSEAMTFEAYYRDRRAALQAQRAELRFREYPLTSDPQGYPQSGAPPEVMAEYEALQRAEANLEDEQRKIAAERRVRAVDAAGLDMSWSALNATDVERRLQRVRTLRAVAAHELARLEADLSAGELVQTGAEAPALTDHRQRLAELRERHGLSDPAPVA